MKDCIFCKIIKKEEKADIIHENDNFVVFKDISPKAPIHLLIAPKRHIKSVKELEDKDLAGEMILLAKKIGEENNLEGYKLVINVGEKGGQIINHIHLHFLGGEKEDLKKIKV